MLIAPPPSSDDAADFWRALLARVDQVDLTGTSKAKFDTIDNWLASIWGIERADVVCKYVQHSNNRWNRLREAIRQQPRAVVLLFDGEALGDVEPRVTEAASACSRLDLVLLLSRPPAEGWRPALLFHAGLAPLPNVLKGIDSVTRRMIRTSPMTGGVPPVAPRRPHGTNLRDALLRLGAGAEESPEARANAAEQLALALGVTPDRIAFKTVPSTKNVGNRVGEALARHPAILVAICPEMLEERVIEEAARWRGTGEVTLLLVLCGEDTRFRLEGPLTTQLRSALDPPPATAATSAAEPCTDEEPPDPSAQWATWSYNDWNSALLNYCFGVAHGSGPVERLAATPEELLVVTGATAKDAAAATSHFVECCVSNVPRGTSFCGFCGDYVARRLRSTNPWTPESPATPQFFAMLWLTCLVAYGYPDADGGFFDRFWRLLGNKDHVTCLPDLWRDISAWTRARRAAGAPIRELTLPPEDDFRSIIGFSHFLAFPHEQDRRHIARVLVDANLVGFEPPISPVLAALQSERDRFSSLFREDLDKFVADFVEGRRDPRESAFWRAVRQETLEPSYGLGTRRARSGVTTILGTFTGDGLMPLLGCSEAWAPPPGFSKQRLDNPIGEFEFYALSDDGDVEAVAEMMLLSCGLLGTGSRALVNQGVLVFQEDQTDEFFLVTGHEVNGADTALVRDDLVAAFVQAFGGHHEPSRVPGWSEVTKCRVRPVDAAPPGLSGVVQLQRTMNPPAIRLVGGIRVAGGYLDVAGFLPRVRASEARDVRAIVNGRESECRRLTNGDFEVPSPVGAEVKLIASWVLPNGVVRTTERTLHLERATIDDRFRPLVSGHYFMESCRPGQKALVGGPPIPLGITTLDPAGSCDFLDWEPSVRFLGPGHGEMSLEPRPGFDWLAVGNKGSPEMLVFIGDVNGPVGPANRRSPASGDRRHWSDALTHAKDIRVRSASGEYLGISAFPAVEAQRSALIRNLPPVDAPRVPATGLKSISLQLRSRPLDATQSVADALAALSNGRGGLSYRTVRRLFEELTGIDGTESQLPHELVRGWTECGAMDLVLSQSYAATRLVARRPRFVVVRRGPHLEASLIGLVTRARRVEVERLAKGRRLELHDVQPGCAWQPSILRIRGDEGVLAEISAGSGLEPMEWLDWTNRVPDYCRVEVERQELWTDVAPVGYRAAKFWNWGTAEFRQDADRPSDRVRVEQRIRVESPSIYVVVVDGIDRAWTYIRNWALLQGYHEAGRAPFVHHRTGWLTTTGRSPVHLPMPLGRICAVLGEGAPGPIIQGSTRHVVGYCYPFGRRVTRLIEQVIPTTWLKDEVV